MPIERNSAAEWKQSYTTVDRAPLRVVRDIPREDRPAVNAYGILWVAFTIAPVVAGLDKFFYFLTDWTQYLSPAVPRITGLSPHTIMSAVGAVEILAGIGVLVRPRFFGYVVAAWMTAVIVNLLSLGAFYDVALRDLGLGLGAVALAQLAATMEMRRKDLR